MTEQILFQLIFLALSSSPADELDQTELATEIKNGNHQAFKTFFENHQDALYRFLLSKGVSEQTAEDLIQQAFITIWEKRNGIDETKSLRGYLFRIAYTRMLNHFRDRAKFNDEEPDISDESSLTPEDHARHQDLLSAVEDAIEQMPEKRRMVFEFCFMQGFTYKETAGTLGVTRKTVENHMGLALKDIRSALGEFSDF
ncbi:sigma-70 family RNA polymerase sigma factor [Aliifodinibius sp. S!AR15-10]|uniref:RNA polymerase sigma factor n=1 Tax=Aliifodinibius sp. S!AR15-10 TaxID=2950437 RepID=UPI0028545745|nr:sigma-70 family RNA polymerase sigma factor [Aliifodinibius sp. S!AR15-10]MDR8390885.1 sigma-70 family RNA polymerase sigma factor [Aliifodinibius sp. S!AR15-10]